MISKTIVVDQDISMLRMLRLDELHSTNSMIINRLDTLWTCHDMLLGRVADTDDVDRTKVKIYARPHLLTPDVEPYLRYAEIGVQLMLWKNDPSLSIKRLETLTLVLAQQNDNPTQDSFLLVRTPSWSNLLAAWKDASKAITGILATDPHSVNMIADQLDVVVESATR